MAGKESQAWGRLKEVAGLVDGPHMERVELSRQSGRPDVDWTFRDGVAGRIELKAATLMKRGGIGTAWIPRASQIVHLRRWAGAGGRTGVVVAIHDPGTGKRISWRYIPGGQTIAWCDALRAGDFDRLRWRGYDDTPEHLARMFIAWRDRFQDTGRAETY